jgi:hypothetical protein
MKIVYSGKHAKHDPQTFFVRGVKQRSAEQPERATRLLAAAKDAGHEVIDARAYGAAPAASVHTADYIDFLQTIARDWAKLPGASTEVVPNVHPERLSPSPPIPGGGVLSCSVGLSAGRRHRPSPRIVGRPRQSGANLGASPLIRERGARASTTAWTPAPSGTCKILTLNPRALSRL